MIGCIVKLLISDQRQILPDDGFIFTPLLFIARLQLSRINVGGGGLANLAMLVRVTRSDKIGIRGPRNLGNRNFHWTRIGRVNGTYCRVITLETSRACLLSD